LGAEVWLGDVVGADRAGERLLAMARQQGFDAGGVVTDESRPTTWKTRLVAGGTTFAPDGLASSELIPRPTRVAGRQRRRRVRVWGPEVALP